MIRVELPWPPTINTYWRRRGDRYFISTEGKRFRRDTVYICHKYKGMFCNDERLKLTVEAYPPDKRRRDIDNLLKVVCDSLEAANVFTDDCQIDEIHIKRFTELSSKVIIGIELCS